jgi:cell wall-associated NlpC family hydrolase
MLSQILFGERYTLTDRAADWVRIRSEFDGYEGWIDTKHLHLEADSGAGAGHVLNRSLLCFREDGSRMVLEAGCEIFEPDYDNKSFSAGGSVYRTVNEFSSHFTELYPSVSETAMKFINSPYIWGGRIPSGIDCSGLVQLAYKIAGRTIPREAADQALEGRLVDFIDEAVPGDLAFFDDGRGKIAHVGMIVSRGLIIHATGRVRIDAIDHQGIFNREINGYSHNLRTIRRMDKDRGSFGM